MKLGPVLLLMHEHRDGLVEMHGVLNTYTHPDGITRPVYPTAHRARSLLPWNSYSKTTDYRVSRSPSPSARPQVPHAPVGPPLVVPLSCIGPARWVALLSA